MKQRLFFAFFVLSLFFTSCGSDNGLDGNWRYDSDFSGTKRSGAVSFVIGDEKDPNQAVFVGTGYDGKDALKTFYKYTAAKGWERIEDFPEAVRDAVAFVAGGKGYVGTGANKDVRYKEFYEYTPAVDAKGNEIGKWNPVPIAEFPGTKRQGAVSFSIGDVGYVGTGYGFLEELDRNFLNDFYKFENGEWSKLNFKGKKSRFATAFVIKNKAYLVSGEGSLQDVWEFDPNATGEKWTKKTPLDRKNDRESVQRTNAVSFVINGKGYVVTGKNPGLTKEVWEYDPVRDEWVERTSLEIEVSPRQDALGFTLNGKGFIATGYNGGYLGDMWEFQPTVAENEDDNY